MSSGRTCPRSESCRSRKYRAIAGKSPNITIRGHDSPVKRSRNGEASWSKSIDSTPASSESLPMKRSGWTRSSGSCWNWPGRHLSTPDIGGQGQLDRCFRGRLGQRVRPPCHRAAGVARWTDFKRQLFGLDRQSGLHFSRRAGPSMAVDTACSSSLVAVHLACQRLRAVNRGSPSRAVSACSLPPDSIAFPKPGCWLLTGGARRSTPPPTATCAARGAAWWCSSASDAQRDGDRIYAVIRGSAVNHDGRTNGLTAPEPPAQPDVLRDAYALAGVSPSDVQFVEAHGTGTALGDAMEVGALGAVVVGRDARKPLHSARSRRTSATSRLPPGRRPHQDRSCNAARDDPGEPALHERPSPPSPR